MNYLKKIKKHLPIIALLFLSCSIAYAQTTEATGAAGGGDMLEKIQKDIENIEQYLGFNPPPYSSDTSGTIKPDTNKPVTLEYSSNSNLLIKKDDVPSSSPDTFMSITPENSATANLFSTFSANSSQPSFIYVNENNTDSILSALGAYINSIANQLFQPIVSINKNLNTPLTNDQSSAQTTAPPISPVSQAVLNILSVTPDSYCGTQDPTSSECTFNYTASKLLANALGLANGSNFNIASFQNPPLKDSMGTALGNLFPQNTDKGGNPQQRVLSQVDSSVFLSPLVYSTETSQDSSKGNSCSGTLNCGLDSQADSQYKNAVNFVSHVTGVILPPNMLPTAKSLSEIQDILTSPKKSQEQKNSAFQSLGTFIIGTRVYAARQSVSLQNIYEILARRLPNKEGSSQALNEFIMATYRLFTPNQTTPGASSWQNKINSASSTTVQKETALLLSEINYQLYLMRQQQERLVLTNSLMLMTNLQLQYPQLQPINK